MREICARNKTQSATGDADMSKLFKRLLCLLLGFIMGISATVGGLATSVYYLYGNMTVADVLPEDKDLQDALGDMKDMSAEDFVGLMRRWLDAPDSFDISDLESKYGFSTVDLVNKLAGGSSDPDDEKNVIKKTEENQPYIDDLKSVSIFSLLSGKVAFKDFMADVPTGAVLAFIPSDTVLDGAQREKLRKYSLGQLISTDEVKNQPGILTALSDLTFGGILPGVFEKNGGVYTVKEGKPQALNLLANIRFGGIFDVITGSSDIGTELVEGGLSPIGEMKVGDFLIDLGVSKEGDELPGKLNAIFDEMQIRDLFEKDVTTNKYKFVVDRLLDRVEIGSIMGYTKKENGTWVQKSGDEETEVNGLLGYLANLNLTDVYHAFADEGTVEQKIHNFLLVFGDLSVGDILETFKYTKDENGVWKKPNGEPVQSELLKSLMDFTIEDVVGDKDSELTGKQIRLNVVAAISKLAGDDLTVAKGLGELFKLKFDEDGNPVKDENGYYLDENGESVGVFKTRLFDIKFKDLAVAFGGDKIELDAIYGVFEESLGGVTLGNVLGMTYSDGSWKNKDGGEITGIVSLLYDIRFGGVFSLVKELENSKEFSFSNVIRGFLPYASMGDIIAPLLGYSKVGEGNEVRYYDKNGGKIEDGLNTVLLLKLWQIAAGFDKNAEFNLKEEIKDVRLGDILNGKCDYDSLGETEWTIFGRTARGNLAKFFDLTLEQLLMTKSEENTRMLEETVKNISLGSVLAFALKYEEGTGDEYGTILGKDEKINGVFDAFLKWDYITYANITGDGFKNKELLREELNNQFGEFMLGETFVPFAAEKLGDGTYNFKTLEQASGLVNILFNTSYETIFNFIFSEDKDVINFIVEVLGDTTIGDVVAPVVGMKKVDDAYVLSKGEGKSIGVAISAILDTKIGRIITLLTDKNDNRTITQKLLGGKTNEEGLINLDFMLGQYVETFLGFKYNKADGKWYDKNEKEIYNPVSRLLSVNMFDLLDHLLGISQKYTADEKKDYLFGILDGIKIGDLLDPIIAKNDKLKDKQLIKLISDIVLVNTKDDENQGLVCDLLDAGKNKLDVINHYFGKIKLGYVAELFLYAKETDAKNHVWTKNDNGETYPVMLGDIFSVSVGYILDIVKNRTGEKDLAVNLVNEVFPQRRVGDLIAIIVPNFADNCQKDGIDNIWGVNKNPLPLVLSDVFDITFETVLNAVIGNQEAIDKVISITDKAFKYEEKADGRKEGRTFNDYFKNFGINDFNDGTLRTIGQTKVGEFIRGVLGKVVKDPFTGETYTTIEYLKMLVGGVAFRDVVGIAVKSVKDLNRPLILSDVIDVSFGDVFDLIDAITNNNLKGGIYKLLKKITNDDYHTLGVYLDDILRGQNAESIIKKNRGIDGLTKIKIAKLVGLILKVDGIRVNSNEGVKKFGVDSTTLDPIINYVLNLTDSVLIGDFLRNSDGSGYRLEDGKWYDDKGNACNDALNTVFNAPTSYVLYLVYGIMNPKLVSEAVKELKVGTVLMPLYNMLIPKAFAGSEMGLKDKDAEEANKEYEIKGAFSAFLTELSNKTIGGVMEDFKNNKPLEVIKNYVLDRPIGDILFDPLSKFLGEKLGLSGFACDANNVNGKGEYTTKKEPLNVIFNINVKEFLDSSDKVGFLKEKAGNLSIGAIAQIALAKLDKNADGTWANNGKNMPLIVSDLFNVKINQLLDIKNNKANLPEYLVNTICGEKRTLRHYLDDLKNDNISKITEKAVLSKLLNDPIVNVVKVVKDNKKQPTEIAKHYFGTAKLGEIAQIALAKLDKNADGTWANDGKAMKLIVSDVFNVTVNQLLEVKGKKGKGMITYLVETICKERTVGDYLSDLNMAAVNKIIEKDVLDKVVNENVIDLVNRLIGEGKLEEKVRYYFGEATIGAIAQIALAKLDKNADGTWANDGKAMKLIVSDVFNVTVNQLLEVKGKKGKGMITYLVETICKERTVGDYLSDLNMAAVNKIIEKDVLDKVVNEKVTDLVNRLIGEGKLEEKVRYYFGEATIGAIAQIALAKLDKNADGTWANDGKAMKLIVSDVFNVTVNQLLEVKNNKNNLPEYLVNTICGEERTLRHYLDDLKNDNISKITEKAVLSKLLDDPVVNVVKVVKDNKKQPTEIVKHYFGTAKLGEFAQLAIKNLAVNEENVWANGTKAMPLIVSDLFDLTVNEVGVFAKNIKNKAKIAEFAGKVTKDDKHTLNVYLEDILKKKITNKGLRELTDIKIAELVSVALKVNDFEVPASKELEKFKINLKTMDGVSKYADVINYVLNITDNVMFGYFKIKVDESGNESGIYFRIEGGKKVWYNEKGEKVSSGMSTVYSIPSSYVLFAVVALAMPGKIIEAVGDYRIGGLIQSFYNKSMTKFDSEIVGSDKKGEFTVEGSFKAVMEDVSNVTVKQIYNALLKDKNFVAKAKEMLLQRPIGDYAYDLIRVLTKGKICKGFACDATDVNGNYVISGNLADVLQATFNIKVNVMLSSLKKGVSGVKQLVKDTYKDFTVGDFTYDVFRKYAATKVRLTAGGTARDYKSNNLVLTGKMAKVFRATFNMKITEAASITKKIKVKNGVLDFVNTYYGKLSLGDVFGAVTEKLVAKKLKVTFNYDVANDYALTISGNFNEVFGAIFASSLGGLIEAYKAKKTAKYFLDEETGVIGKLPLGDILAYVCKTKSLEKQMKYTEIEKGEDGKWSVKGAYETPLDIAFNKLTIGKVYKERANFRKNILKPYFDAVKVGELMGGRYDKANDEWIKPNGEVVKSEDANGIIMTKIYMLTIEEVTKKDFKVTNILDGIYAGEILGYYYCGHYKFTTDENETRYTFCEPENSHKDYEYHVHDDGEMYSKKSEFVTALSGIKLCADAAHTDENHKWHYHDKIDCTFKSHTDTTHTLGGWYKDEGGTEKVGAIENAFANVRLGHLMSGSFEFSDIVRGVKLGEAMNMIRCGGSDETCDIPDATHEHKAGVWYKLNESTNTYEASGVLLDRIADKDLGDIFDKGLNLGETFDGVLLGDVMGYKYCNGASDCTYKDADPTHTHIASGSKKVWYVLDDKGTPDASDDVYSRATTLETILANVSMRSVIDGDFSIETQIKNVKIGELMSYEYCDGTNECLPHGSGAHAEGWYRNDSGTWTKITDNLILCVADFTITDIRKDDFGTRLSSKVKASVTVGDIFEETQTGPLSLIPSTTKVGDISAAIQDAIENSTAIDLFNAGVLPIKSDNGANTTAPGGTLEKLDSTFDKIRPYVIAGGVDTDGSGTIGDSAIDIVITFTAEEKAKATAAETISAEDKVTYQIADGYQYDNGRKFWGSLKLEEMVDVLLSIVTATV